MDRRAVGIAVLLAAGLAALAGCPGDEVAGDEQGAIEGHVILEEADDHSGVEVTGEGDSTTTDEEGYYRLEWQPVGEVEVTADHPAYVAETKTAGVEAGEVATVDFELQPGDLASIEAVGVEPEEMVAGQVADVEVVVSNPGDRQLEYRYEVDDPFEVDEIDGAEAQLFAPEEFGVTGVLSVEIEDPDGITDQESVEIRTREHDDPIIESISVMPDVFEPGETGELNVEATAPYDDELTIGYNVPSDWSVDPETGDEVELTAPQEPNVEATVEVVVTDEFGGETTDSVDVSTRDNNPPEITGIVADPPQVRPGGEIELSAEATDPDGGELDYLWLAPSQWAVSGGDQPDATLVAPDEYGNTAEVELEVTDEYGAVSTAVVVVSTVTNQGPQIEAIEADPLQVQRGGIIDLSVEASHPDDQSLSYDWTAPGGWEFIGDGSTAEPELQAPDQPGETATVEVVVTDLEGDEAVTSILVGTNENQPPVIEALDADPAAVVPGETTTISAEASDPDGQDLVWDWDVPADWSGSSDNETIELVAPDEYAQSATVELTVDDGWDTTSATVSVSTVQNVDPNILSFQASPSTVDREETSVLSIDAEHPYGEPLDYHWEIDNDDWTIDADDQTAELIAPDIADDQVVVTVEVTDDYGGSTESSLSVATPQNNPPVISSLTAEPMIVDREETTELDVDAQDPDGGELSYEWSIDNDDWTLQADDEPAASATAPDAYESSATVTVTVEDDHEATTSSSVVVQTTQNVDPVITSLTADPEVLDREASSELAVEAADPNGEDLEYDWSIEGANEQQWTLDAQQDTATLQAPDIPEDAVQVTISVDDGYGGVTSQEITVETEANNPPVIENIAISSDDPDDEWVERDGQAQLFADVDNPDGDDLDYDWSVSSPWSITGDDDQADLDAPGDNDTSGTVTLTVSDGWDSDTEQLDVRTRDTEPDAFGFEDEEKVDIAETIISEDVEMTGFDGPLEAVCTDCEVSVEGGAFDDTVGGIEPSETIRIRTTSSSEPEETVTATVTVGDTTSEAWSVTTMDWKGQRDFNNCGQTGRLGPSQSDCDAEYDGTALEGEVTLEDGIQQWTVPADGNYRIEVWGAQGGDGGESTTGGYGARMRGDFELEAGDELDILVGQRGGSEPNGGGGGGGAFVVDEDDNPLIIAGGGGGANGYEGYSRGYFDGEPGLTGTAGGDSNQPDGSYGEPAPGSGGGDIGHGGTDGWGGGGAVAAGGGGFFDRGGTAHHSADPGTGYLDGAQGGDGRGSDNEGGFGAGGGGSTSSGYGGGGGGYSGGGAGNWNGTTHGNGGGGGSYNAGDNQDEDPGVQTGHGRVTIDRIAD